MAYDFEALRQSIERRANPECPTCGSPEWTSTEAAALLHSVGPDRSMKTGAGFPVMPLVCTRCGFVRLHSISVLQGNLDPDHA